MPTRKLDRPLHRVSTSRPQLAFEAVQADQAWAVHVNFPDERYTRINGFATKAEANEWIENMARSWLAGYQGGRYA
jgi:hypothetical protein